MPSAICKTWRTDTSSPGQGKQMLINYSSIASFNLFTHSQMYYRSTLTLSQIFHCRNIFRLLKLELSFERIITARPHGKTFSYHLRLRLHDPLLVFFFEIGEKFTDVHHESVLTSFAAYRLCFRKRFVGRFLSRMQNENFKSRWKAVWR